MTEFFLTIRAMFAGLIGLCTFFFVVLILPAYLLGLGN